MTRDPWRIVCWMLVASFLLYALWLLTCALLPAGGTGPEAVPR